MAAIVAESLTKSYGGRGTPLHRSASVRALHDLSIEVREGEIFGFLGPNGAGKSTTIRLLLGYLHPTSGRAEVLGRDIVKASEDIRRRTGYLPGGIAFYDTMTGAEQLRYLADLDGRPAPLRDELIERMELSQADLRRQIRDYSRGMRQNMQRSFYEILEDRQRAGRTIFFSSHILSEAERVCDRVAIVRKGELVALTDIGELLHRRRRRVEVCFEGAAPELTGVAGVSDVQVRDDVLTCQLEGDPGELIAAMRGISIRDLLIEPARLEEAFMEYYADEVETPGSGGAGEAA